jgi:hypothetical protein
MYRFPKYDSVKAMKVTPVKAIKDIKDMIVKI